MTERGYEDAVQALHRRIGGRWEGLETEGRDEMAAVLKDELGYDDTTAHDAIEAMIRSGQLRYSRGGGEGGSKEIVDDEPEPIPMSPIATGMAVPAAGFDRDQGYWEIGEGSDSGWEGRSGQVQPR